MLTLFGNLESGNVHKVQMILRRLDRPYRRVDVAQVRGEPRVAEFRAVNPIAKVPALLMNDGDVLSESGAILYYYGRDTELWPADLRRQSEVLRWMFFEQYSHEPALAVIRYLLHFSTEDGAAERARELLPRGRHVLEVMQRHLEAQPWMTGDSCSLADYALYPYTAMMDACGFDRSDYPSIDFWLARVGQERGFLAMGEDGAEETLSFSEYFTNRT